MSNSDRLSPSLVSSRQSRWVPAVSQTQACMGPGCLIAFFAIFMCFGFCFLGIVVVRELFTFRAAQSWPEVPCVILDSRLQTHSDSDGGTTYSPKITYEYSWQGQTYTSDRYQVSEYSSSFRNAHQQVVDSYPKGRQAVCYVNPDEPNYAILDRSHAPGMYLGLILGAVFTLVGVGGVVGTILYRMRQKRRAVDPNSADRDAGADNLAPNGLHAASFPSASAGTANGPQVLAPKQSRMMVLAVASGIALFWNGIVSVFVVVIVNSFLDGDPQWCMTVFLIPFVVVGLSLLLIVLYTFLTLFNPTPQLTLAQGVLRLGGPLVAQWEFRGGTSRIRKLTVILEGEEVATYRQGTSTATDRSTFYRDILAEVTLPSEIPSGRVETHIPLALMHSWKATNNQVEWHLKIHGEIPFFPDIKEDFSLDVRPAELWEEV